jgi:hypothetical protein
VKARATRWCWTGSFFHALELPFGRAAGEILTSSAGPYIDEARRGRVAAERVLQALALIARQIGEERLERGEENCFCAIRTPVSGPPRSGTGAS